MPAVVFDESSQLTAPKHIRVGGAVMTAQLIDKVQPTYPSEAKERGIQGVVKLQVIVAKDGTILELQVISGDSILAEAATAAVRQWRYQPTLLDGRPVEVVSTIDVIFRPAVARLKAKLVRSPKEWSVGDSGCEKW